MPTKLAPMSDTNIVTPGVMGGVGFPFKMAADDFKLANSIRNIGQPELIKIKRLHPSAVIPAYATDGSGCFDITALEMVEQKGNTAVYTTGLAFEVPPGKVLMLYSRSGHGFNRGIRLANCVGVIDSDYRGEVAVKLTRDNDGIWFPAAGERIAQGLIQDASRVKFVEVEELSDTGRGTGGFGSTG